MWPLWGVDPRVDGANGKGGGSIYLVAMANASVMDGLAVDGRVGKGAMANVAGIWSVSGGWVPGLGEQQETGMGPRLTRPQWMVLQGLWVHG